jgi:DNA modification methylase
MPPVTADLVITDPPYNMAYEGAGKTPEHKRKNNKIINDKLPDEEFEKLLFEAYSSMYSVMREGASCYVFYKELGKGVFLTAMERSGLTFKQQLIWVKSQLVLGGSKYQNIFEPCLFGCKGKSVKFWYAGRKETSVIESVDLMNEFELRFAIKEILESIETDIVREKKQLKNDLHPTMKPVKLLARFMRNSSKKDDIVFDLFGGSGTTLIAAEQMGRRCRTLELDERFADVIVKRWEALTENKAELIERAD